MSRYNEYTLKQVIEELLNAYRLKGKINESRLIQSWEKVCGALISRHTENLYISNRKLYVKVDSAALRNELSYAKTKLLVSLNKSVGEDIIDEIVLM
jgi:predicted nucleic acid-binding Zn ribbon protein